MRYQKNYKEIIEQSLGAKKSLGQHFLRSEKALSTIIDAADPAGDDIILEIGPGKGVLTEKLLMVAKKVIAVEKDRDLVAELSEKFQTEIQDGKLDLREQDILDFNPETLRIHNHPYKIVANIPYYITGAILRKFLTASFQPEQMVLLIQKEVAERIIARDGKESLLSISVKVFGEPKLIEKVPAGAFAPPPKVDSAILSINTISRKQFDSPEHEENFFDIIHAAFGSKRKFAAGNLERAGYARAIIDSAFQELGIPLKARAEDIAVEKWCGLARTLKKI